MARSIRPLLIAITVLCSSLVLSAQTAAAQDDANRSSTDTVQTLPDNVNPTRTAESHVQSGNRTQDNQSVQRRNADGNFEPYQDIEKTTVKVDSSTVRTTTRTFARDSDGAKTLVQVTEEVTHTRPGGDSSVTRSTSNPDADGKLQLVQREIEDTKKTGIDKDVEETKRTVMLPGGNGDLAPAMMTEERRKHGADDTVEAQKTTLLPDGNGKWQVSEVKQATTRQDKDGKNRSTDERVSQPDADGKLGEISHTVSKESESAGENRKTVETYSLDTPGTARDGNLHLVERTTERTTTAQGVSSNGQQNTKRQLERPDPGNPDAGLQIMVVSTDSGRTDASGARNTQTVQMRDANGSMGVVSVDTTKSDGNQAVQVQIGPATAAAKPK